MNDTLQTIGEVFRDAREKKKVTTSKAAAATRMKVQHIEAMEKNDFAKFAAPTYSKGFIKLYAEYLGLDPKPLIAQYMAAYAPSERAPLLQDDKPAKQPREPIRIPWDKIPWQKMNLSRNQWLALGKAAGVVVAVVAVAGLFKKCSPGEPPEQVARTPVVRVHADAAIIAEPPEPFLEVDLFSK